LPQSLVPGSPSRALLDLPSSHANVYEIWQSLGTAKLIHQPFSLNVLAVV